MASSGMGLARVRVVLLMSRAVVMEKRIVAWAWFVMEIMFVSLVVSATVF